MKIWIGCEDIPRSWNKLKPEKKIWLSEEKVEGKDGVITLYSISTNKMIFSRPNEKYYSLHYLDTVFGENKFSYLYSDGEWDERVLYPHLDSNVALRWYEK